MKLIANRRKKQWKKYVRVQLAWHALCHTGESIPTKHTITQSSQSSHCASRIQILQLIDWYWREVVQKDCQAHNLNREDAMDCSRWKKLIKIG